MMKLAVLVLLVGCVASDGMNLVSSQRAVIPHHTPYGYRNGISSRYFDKVDTGFGLYGPRTMVYDGVHNLGLGYGKLGMDYGRHGYDALGLGYGILGLGYGRFAYRPFGLRYGNFVY